MFYTRPDCPLCEDAWRTLEERGLTSCLVRKDISVDAELTRTYGWRIPVVALALDQEFDIALGDQLHDCLQVLLSHVASG